MTDNGATRYDLWRTLGVDGEPVPMGSARVEPAHRHDESEAGPEAFDRRRLMQLTGATLALAGLGGCNSGTQFGAPLLSRPRSDHAWAEGVPIVYATAVELGGIARGVLVETIDGRPVKIEGNPLHPGSLGATDAFMQAEILSLYDPDRSRRPLELGLPVSWRAAHAMLSSLAASAQASGGRGLHIVMGPSGSPTLSRMVEVLAARLPAARLYRHDPIGNDNARLGALRAFGRAATCACDLAAADVVLSLGDDLLGAGPHQVRHAAGFAERRRRGRQSGDMPRMIVAETTPSLTGARADRCIALAPREIERLAFQIAVALGLLSPVPDGADRTLAQAIAAELSAAGAASLVSAGRGQPPAVQALAHAMNLALGAAGRTVRYLGPGEAASPRLEALSALRDALARDEVGSLVLLAANPVYDGPADLGLAGLMARVPLSIHLGGEIDETARACRWHLPALHPLESWGDATAFDGTASIVQPVTTPLSEGMSSIELLARLAGNSDGGMALVRATWAARWGADAEARWQAALVDGMIAGTRAAAVPVTLSAAWREGLEMPAATDRATAVFAPDPSMWDGRYARNAWLQELPKPLTKQAWGNAALIASATALKSGLLDGDVVRITAGGRTIEAPVMIVPGHAGNVITLPLGYGRTVAGPVGSQVGFDAYRVRTSASPWAVEGVTIEKAGRRIQLVTTQHHTSLEGRDIVRVVGLQDAAAAHASAPPPPLASLYPEHRYEGHAWGMTVDLDQCIGCNACVIACQAENNIPVVGPREVAQGREMHWMRIDLYHSGAAATPETWHQPVLCMHCEKAPCEVVCPVNATVHSSEGLNDMVYNRCIGTRTCSNNCPYKVRRFNWFDYAGREPGKAGASLNPDVSVRPRGVMEKCTFCTQRISAARIAARIEGRPIRDGDIVTACQQACPAGVFTFGDVNDPESAVSRSKREGRNYALLGELNTRPRTTYLARIAAREGAADGS